MPVPDAIGGLNALYRSGTPRAAGSASDFILRTSLPDSAVPTMRVSQEVLARFRRGVTRNERMTLRGADATIPTLCTLAGGPVNQPPAPV
jgi:hypothetical protein